jgi:sensor histidine kinase regulating citrate/malate metabolism
MLDNAIEACERAPREREKRIEVTLGMKNDFVYFSVSNTADGLPLLKSSKIVTAKKDKARHGHGISIMQRIVHKYDGAFDIIPSENSFLVRAALKNTQKGR